MIDNTEYLLSLHSVHGLGAVRLKALLDYYQDPKLVWEADPKELLKLGIFQNVVNLFLETRKKLVPEKYLEYIRKCGIFWVTIFDESYPKLLKEIYDPPVVLYYQGEIRPEDEKAVAVVGTRQMTGYGSLVTEKFVTGLSEAGVTIVSGLARGVDTQAHKTAVKLKGRTLAILGGGLNNIFPQENIGLAREITSGFGAIISEFPPDDPSLPGNFPARNRIISGLSKVVLVTEAAEDSGSLITAKLALEQGRDVFAIPGPITSHLSGGPSFLIKQGARLVTDPSEILDELGLEISKKETKLTDMEKKILGALSSESKHVDEVCRELKMNMAQASGALLKMEIYGLVKNLGGGIFTKIC